MICNLTYASASELTRFVAELRKLRNRWPQDFPSVCQHFSDIAYNLFVVEGIPFTEAVQFLQEFGSSIETEKAARSLFTPNEPMSTQEERDAERIKRRDGMREVVMFFNSMMSVILNPAAMGAAAEASRPILVSAEQGAKLFSVTTAEFKEFADSHNFPFIRVGKDAVGHEILRYPLKAIEGYLTVASKASFLDRNSFIYQRNLLSFPDEETFSKLQKDVIQKDEELRRKAKAEREQKQQAQKQQPQQQKPRQQSPKPKQEQKPRQPRKESAPWTVGRKDFDPKKAAEEAEKKENAAKPAEKAKPEPQEKPQETKKPEPDKAPESPKPTSEKKEEKPENPKPSTGEKPVEVTEDAAKETEKTDGKPDKKADGAPALEFPGHFTLHQQNKDFGNDEGDPSGIAAKLLDFIQNSDSSEPDAGEASADAPEDKKEEDEKKEEPPSQSSTVLANASPAPKSEDVEGLDGNGSYNLQ